MQTKEYKTLPRKGWPSGPWDSEPDKVQWPDPDTGLPCLAVRNQMGAWCGYVGVAEGHVLYGTSYSEVQASVHGGLTFADKCRPSGNEAEDICHLPGPGEPDHVWWLGFDCAHYMDLCPHEPYSLMGALSGTYRTLEFVKDQCTQLAQQLAHYQPTKEN